MYKIIADSSSDTLSLDYVNFESVPLTIATDEKEFIDDAALDCHAMLDHLESYHGRSYTACPSTASWMHAFHGADELYVVTMTSGLSGTYNSARVAAEHYLEDHPDTKILCVDTLSTGPEMRLVIEKIAQLKTLGTTFEQMDQKIRQYMEHTGLLFSLPSLHNFAQNGRVSKILAASVELLGIQFIGKASPKGTLDPIGKCRGTKKLISSLLTELGKAGYMGGKLRLSHNENKPLADQLKSEILRLHPAADIDIYPARGLCSYYAERGGILIGYEA